MIPSQQHAAVAQFGYDHALGQRERGQSAVRRPKLGNSQLYVFMTHCPGYAFEPTAVGEMENGDGSIQQFARGLCRNLYVAEHGQVGNIQQPGISDNFLLGFDRQPVSGFADYAALAYDIHGQSIVPCRHHAPNVIGFHDDPTALQEGDFVRQTDADQGASGAFGTVFQRRRDGSLSGHPAHGSQQFPRPFFQRCIKKHGDATLRPDEVQNAFAALEAMGFQEQALKAQLHAFRFVGVPGNGRYFASLIVNRNSLASLGFNQIDASRGPQHLVR